MDYEAVIGLEIHAELLTLSKMFCSCPVVDSSQAEPNSAVCPVCAGMPGTLPVANCQAIEFALKMALALNCQVQTVSIFARKNYFYPDLPKGYQISQYEQPMAINGWLTILTPSGEHTIRIRRVHLEEDAGKLTHLAGDLSANPAEPPRTLVDLNRAGVPLLEIVTEPDMRSGEEVRLFAMALRDLLRYLGVNSGDMEKGVLRIEPNVSVRPAGSLTLGTRTEIKNLNSFRALERSVAYETIRQSALLASGQKVEQQTLGWDDLQSVTIPQRSKEQAHDYRYFPEPDLPPLVIESDLLERLQSSLPELPLEKYQRFRRQYQLGDYDASLLVSDAALADYFEQTVAADPSVPAKTASNWITGELFSLMNQSGMTIVQLRVPPGELSALIAMHNSGRINQNTAKSVLGEMFASGETAGEIVSRRGLSQVSDPLHIAGLVRQVLANNPDQVQSYLDGKEALSRWFFGQVMREANGQANPQVVQTELDRQLAVLRDTLHTG